MLPYTSLLTGVFAIMVVVLALQVSIRRRQLRISLGDGNDDTLRRRIRAHGNFIEYVPLALIALGLVEASGAPASLVSGIAIAMLLARIIHAIGIVYSRRALPRVIAMVIQNTAFIVAAYWLVTAGPPL